MIISLHGNTKRGDARVSFTAMVDLIGFGARVGESGGDKRFHFMVAPLLHVLLAAEKFYKKLYKRVQINSV